ncbi:MAG: ABC transporter permease [archaeon]|nr:ABC transporter permease [Candidatus Bathyarchaeum sp.]
MLRCNGSDVCFHTQTTPQTGNDAHEFVRIPLLFISGVFIPISELPSWGQFLSGFSPLTHTIELAKGELGGENIFAPFLNVAA